MQYFENFGGQLPPLVARLIPIDLVILAMTVCLPV